jgi:hypothetical protein
MEEKKFFSVSGIACAAHTLETKKIWQLLPDNKSDYGRMAVLRYAKDLGFKPAGEVEITNLDLETAKEAFNYLINQFPPNVSGIKSFVLRRAIIHYS